MEDLLKMYEYLDEAPESIQKAIDNFAGSLVYPILLILGKDRNAIEVVIGGSTEDAINRPDSYDDLILVNQHYRV